MRLGSIIPHTDSPETWIQQLQTLGFRAAYCPLAFAPQFPALAEIQAYESVARAADILIAEVGVWNNPISPDETTRQQAIFKCQQGLALAEEIGAQCCVNIAGSRGTQWDGPHPDNYSAETFDLIVETVRAIIDAVNPKRTFYTLETMPWCPPDSPDNYLDLIQAIDRPRFAVHLDPVNMITNPRRYYQNKAFLEECFSKLGTLIKSCHAKDITLRSTLTVHLDEVRPGLGTLDYAAFIRGVNNLGDVPIMLEHLPDEEYPAATAYVRGVAQSLSIAL